MSGDRLAHLRQVAQAADNGSPWEWEHAYPQRITRVGDVVLVAECFENPDMPSRFAEFIATFDPPTVLALVEIARGMERIEKTCDVVVQRIAEVGEPPAALSGTQIDAERMRDFARAALARLDRSSSDGTADSGATDG